MAYYHSSTYLAREQSYPYTRSLDKDTHQGSQIRKGTLLAAHYSIDCTDFYFKVNIFCFLDFLLPFDPT